MDTQQLLQHLLCELVDEPSAVRVVCRSGAQANIFELHVAPADVATLTGRNGETLSALRVLADAGKDGREARVEVVI